jgi:malate/lactate dehydrogenase
VTVGAIRLEQYGLPDGTSLPVIQHDLAAAVRGRGRSIHDRKGFTSYGVAAAVARIVRAIVRDEKRIFMVSVLAAQAYGVGPVALSLPCIVGRGGIVRQLMLTMSEEERRMLEHSASILDQAYKSLSPGQGTTTTEKRDA